MDGKLFPLRFGEEKVSFSLRCDPSRQISAGREKVFVICDELELFGEKALPQISPENKIDLNFIQFNVFTVKFSGFSGSP